MKSVPMDVEQQRALLAWYGGVSRALPWRETREPYRVLVSEFMLQQTTVAAVVPLYLRWMARFPTVEALAQASLDEVMEAWSGLGYYQRARRLHSAAKALWAAGCYPQTLAQWLELPGFGPYTAAAVASIAQGLPHLALDTNALRVLLRYHGWLERADKQAVHQALRDALEPQLSGVDFGIFNQAVMELGASLCSVRGPACLLCPLARGCRARQEAIQDRIPVAVVKKPAKLTPATVTFVSDAEGGVFLWRGTSLGLLGDLFAPPISFHEEDPKGSPFTSVLRWLDGEASDLRAFGVVGYGISGRKLTLSLRHVQSDTLFGELQSEARSAGLTTARLDPAGQSSLALSSLSRKLLQAWVESL